MGLGDLIRSVADALTGRDRGQEADPRVRPASEDPLGDPADQIDGHSVRPASEDPLGDPADALDGRKIRPASEDPLGDPADQQNRGPFRRR
jgi:hypothetical protein